MIGKWRLLTRLDPLSNGHDVAIVFDRPDGTRHMAKPLVMEDLDERVIAVPTFHGKDGTEFLRAALNAAWEAGLRPDGFDNTRESMAATNAHLQDMRAIAFHSLNLPAPGRKSGS